MNSKAFKEAVADIKSQPISKEERERRKALRDRIHQAIDKASRPTDYPSWVDTIKRKRI